MKLISYFFLLCLLSFTVGFSQPVTLQKTFGGTASDGFNNIQLTADSGYIMIGTTYSFGVVNGDIYLVKTDKNGDSIWTKTIGTKYHEFGNFIKQTSDGGYILIGNVIPDTNKIIPYDGGASLIFLVKTDSYGNPLWTKYLGWDCGSYGASCVSLTPDSGFLILGGKSGAFPCPLPRSIFLIKTNSSGDTLWTKTLFSPDFGDWGGNYMTATKDSNYIITGSGNPASTVDTKVFLMKIDPNGNDFWNKSYGSAGSDRNEAYCVQQTSDGGYVICGYNNDTIIGSSYFYLIKTDKNGDTLFTKTGMPDIFGVSTFVRENKLKEYIITGRSQGDVFLINIDSIGNILWKRTYGGVKSDAGSSLLINSDNRYIIAGITESFGSGSWDGYLIITDSLGNATPIITKGSKDFINVCIQLYPNPNNGIFLLTIYRKDYSEITINVSNVLGQVLEKHIYAVKSVIFTKEFNIQHLPNGIYFLSVKTHTNMYYFKLIKN